jgi:hypothetical protein
MARLATLGFAIAGCAKRRLAHGARLLFRFQRYKLFGREVAQPSLDHHHPSPEASAIVAEPPFICAMMVALISRWPSGLWMIQTPHLQLIKSELKAK